MIKLFKKIIRLIRYNLDPIDQARRDGVIIGKRCRLIGKVTFSTEPYLITIGDHVSITNSQLVTHDGGVWVFRDKSPEIDLFGKITIGSNVFIGTGCIILPGTTIENNVVVGAGSIVRGHLEENSVYAGVPARKIKLIDQYYEKAMKNILLTKKYDYHTKKNLLENHYLNDKTN